MCAILSSFGCLLLLLPLAGAVTAQAAATQLRVRVLAHDAKIIGSSVGGARVTITDLATGELLASGVQEGSTGNTGTIIGTPWERGATIFDVDGTGLFEATLLLDAPTRVEVVAEGPLGTEHAIQRASKTLLLVPGVDIVGEGLILELNGFTVEIQAPTGDETSVDGSLTVKARVTMLCGCPTEPGGLWDADRMRILARLIRGSEVVVERELDFAGETSIYQGTIVAPGPGSYNLQVLAIDPERANTGIAVRRVTVR
jgi:hypothetical protein